MNKEDEQKAREFALAYCWNGVSLDEGMATDLAVKIAAWKEQQMIELKPQPHWKPSEEQMKALKEACCYSSVFSERTIKNLYSLLVELKTLCDNDI